MFVQLSKIKNTKVSECVSNIEPRLLPRLTVGVNGSICTVKKSEVKEKTQQERQWSGVVVVGGWRGWRGEDQSQYI